MAKSWPLANRILRNKETSMLIPLILIIALLLCLVGISLLLKPEPVISFIEHHAASKPLYASAIIIRLALGLLLITYADLSRFPRTITVLGWIAIIAAEVFTWMGQPRFTSMLQQIMTAIKPVGRVGGGLGLAFGLFLFYAFL